MKRVFVTTTNSIENAKIIEYKGLVTSNIVAGTGFLSDFTAGLSDFFGGRSGTYRRQMESLYSEALDEISFKAQKINANAVIGFRIDFDNISGKGMSMFMISITGTAVVAAFEKGEEEKVSEGEVPAQMLKTELDRRYILGQIEKAISEKGYIKEDVWDMISLNPQDDYAIPLSNYLSLSSDVASLRLPEFAKLIPLFSREVAIKSIYPLLKTSQVDDVIQIIIDNLLFDADSILELIEGGNVGVASQVLSADKPSYNNEDLLSMRRILAAFNSLPDTGRVEMSKGGVFSKEEEKYICLNGHPNRKSIEYCEVCGRNIKGLSWDDVRQIKKFEKKIDALESLLA